MARVGIIICWLLVTGVAVWLRFDDLGARPFHADEATGARITGARMSGEGGQFDPRHYHGPLLGDAALLVCRARGESGWEEMTKETLRIVPALAGLCVVFLPLLWQRVAGQAGALLAGLLLSVSPLLAYYSRMFIHEMLLVLAGGAFLACIAGKKPRPVCAGVCLGLMFAVKETFVISVMAWAGALAAVMICGGVWRSRSDVVGWVRGRWCFFVWMAGTAMLVSLVCYTRLFTYPVGAWHAVKTFFVYETVSGHDKPWWWYVRWIGWPEKSAGVWWVECVVLWWAMLLWLVSFVPGVMRETGLNWLRFLGFSFLGHVVIYSVFSYKTPWLMCLPWLHVCLMAGFGPALLKRRVWRGAAEVLVAFGLAVPMSRLSSMAVHRLSSDVRNPYAYVPTSRNAERLEEFLSKLRPLAEQDVVAVVGADYWPVPWYVRSFGRAGYWTEDPGGLDALPFVLVMPDQIDRVAVTLEGTHNPLPYGLRPEVPVVLMVRNDVWKRWMEDGK